VKATQDHALYRFFDDDGNLLYVGITLDPGRRWRKHRGRPWWRFVADITVEQYTSRSAVLRAERRAIITEHPALNVLHNRGDQLADEPIDLFEIMCSPGFGSEPAHMPDICHDGCLLGLRIRGSDLYYPYSWRRGLAHYQCDRGHHWTCKWGHHRSGEAMQNAGRAQEISVP
jgi:hypothetical protein